MLVKVSGRLRPGTTSLILAPPGASKTAYLRAITQRLAPERVTGSLRYGGLSPAEAAAKGINLRSLLYYVDQIDQHFGQLTVSGRRLGSDNVTLTWQAFP